MTLREDLCNCGYMKLLIKGSLKGQRPSKGILLSFDKAINIGVFKRGASPSF